MSKTFKIVIWLVIIAAIGVIAWKLFGQGKKDKGPEMHLSETPATKENLISEVRSGNYLPG